MAKVSSKLIVRIIFIVITFGILAFLFFNENGVLKYLKLKSEIRKLDTEIRKSEEKLRALQSEIDSLKVSKVKIEKVARERYNMMLPNEDVLRVDEN